MTEVIQSDESPRVDPVDTAASLASDAQIHAVTLVKSKASRLPDIMIADEDKDLAIEILEVRFGRGDTSQFVVMPTFALALKRKSQPEAPAVFAVEASFVLFYSHASGKKFEDNAFEAFASTSGVFNAWPYWREFAQNMAVRMAVDPIVVPLFRVGHSISRPEKPTAIEEASTS